MPPIDVPEVVKGALKDVDQDVSLTIDAGFSLEDLLASDESMVKNLLGGFSFTFSLDVVANIKKVILKHLEKEGDGSPIDQMVAQAMMVAGPAFMIGTKGSLEFDFDDYDEIKDHPMAGPFLASAKDLMMGLIGEDVEEILSRRAEVDEEASGDKDRFRMYYKLKNSATLLNTIVDIFQAMGPNAEVLFSGTMGNLMGG